MENISLELKETSINIIKATKFTYKIGKNKDENVDTYLFLD